MTDTPMDSIYSGVVSIPGIRLVTFIAELNGLELWATDIGNAYLESVMKERWRSLRDQNSENTKGTRSSY